VASLLLLFFSALLYHHVEESVFKLGIALIYHLNQFLAV
jgi:hypothetical protein